MAKRIMTLAEILNQCPCAADRPESLSPVEAVLRRAAAEGIKGAGSMDPRMMYKATTAAARSGVTPHESLELTLHALQREFTKPGPYGILSYGTTAATQTPTPAGKQLRIRC
jgi:hypothetical protein